MNPISVHAATIQTVDNVATLSGFEGLFENILVVLLPLAGIVLFIMLILAGISLITAGSDPKKAQSSKSTITYAIMGMVLIALAYLILNFIASFTGADYLRRFKIRIV